MTTTVKYVLCAVAAVAAVLVFVLLPVLIFCLPDVKQWYQGLKGKLTALRVKHAVKLPAAEQPAVKREASYI